jgi:hypothetical protein
MYRLFYYSYRLEPHLFLITPSEQKDIYSGLKDLSSECLQTFCFQDEVLTFDHPGDLIVDSEFFVSGI